MFPQNKFLGNEVAPTFAIIFRAVRADKKVLGYQMAVYLDKPTKRLQIILAALAADNNRKLCADGILLSKYKVMVRYCPAYIIYLRTLCKKATIRISCFYHYNYCLSIG